MADATKKVELKLNPEQIRKLDRIKSHAGLNNRTDTVRLLIQEKFLALARLPHNYSVEIEEDN
jgi:hypothetical protein